MFCPKCGKVLSDRATMCPDCGQPTGNEENSIAIIGFVLSFFIWIAGLICSIIGLSKAKKAGGKGRGFAVAGIVISLIPIGLIIFYITIMITVFGIIGPAL